MIGTPERTSVAKVRLKRARQTFWKRGPKIGSLSVTRSRTRIPMGVLRNIMKAMKAPNRPPYTAIALSRRKLDASSTAWVIKGRSMSIESKTFLNVGTTPIIRKPVMPRTRIIEMIGYVMADLISRASSSADSM